MTGETNYHVGLISLILFTKILELYKDTQSIDNFTGSELFKIAKVEELVACKDIRCIEDIVFVIVSSGISFYSHSICLIRFIKNTNFYKNPQSNCR